MTFSDSSQASWRRATIRGCGLLFAAFLQFISISTLNFQSFSQLAFGFTLTPGIVVKTLLFSLVMGFVGGFLPAMEASRLKIVDALRAA